LRTVSTIHVFPRQTLSLGNTLLQLFLSLLFIVPISSSFVVSLAFLR
jgi:hypothetical protein